MGRTKIKTRARTYYKITNKNENHRGFVYKTGLNKLDKPFAKKDQGDCVAGGLYFTDKTHLHFWYDFGVNIREVAVPVDAQFVKLFGKYRADKIVFKKKHPLYSVSTVELFKLKITNTYVRKYLHNSVDSTEDQVKFLKKHKIFANSLYITHINGGHTLLSALLAADVFTENTVCRLLYSACTFTLFKTDVTAKYLSNYLLMSPDHTYTQIKFLKKHKKIANKIELYRYSDELFSALLVANVFTKAVLRLYVKLTQKLEIRYVTVHSLYAFGQQVQKWTRYYNHLPDVCTADRVALIKKYLRDN